MPETIRLNKVLKELNISIDRAVNFLSEKEVEIDRNPNTKIDGKTYKLLIEEFQSDAKQKAASEEVVIHKIPEKESAPVEEEIVEIPEPEKEEEKIEEEEIEEIEEPEEIKESEKVEEVEETEVKETISKETKPEPEEEKPVVAKEEEKKEEVKQPEKEEKPEKESKTKESTGTGRIELEGVKTLGKIDLDKLKPKKNKKKDKKKEESKKTEKKADIKKAPKKEAAGPKQKEVAKPEEEHAEPEKIETVYQKLEGLSFTGEKVDLSEFEKDSKLAKERKNKEKKEKEEKKARKKRKRIRKEVKPGDAKGKTNDSGKKKKRKSRRHTEELTEEEISKQIKETLEKLTSKGGKSRSAKHRRDRRRERQEILAQEQAAEDRDKTLDVTEFVTVNELASLMNVGVTEVISACMSLGVMVTMNQRLEADTIQLVGDHFGFDVNFANAEEELEIEEEEEDSPEDLVPRAPIITVMGHVDHGKTSLLDYIRKANVIAGESGGITQHIGAYNVQLDSGKRITFLDTPGHEAFTAMRARGAQVTDVAIIVIAADDQIMPQTREAISHAQAANVPIVFAINKIDKPTANPDKVKEQLAAMNLLVEDWGGSIQSEDISAKKGTNVKELLEKVVLEAEVQELKANPDRLASGVVVEASLDKGRGYVSTLLVQNGSLEVGDYLVAGSHHGKVRAMLDERGKRVEVAGPSTPVTILGLDGAPTAGDKFRVFEDEHEAKQIANRREQLQREITIRTQKHITLDEIGRRIALGDFQELNIILKGDVDGSVEALTDSLQKLSTEEIHVNILHKGVGQITESDVLLASASDAVIIGFNVRPGTSAKELADKEEIEIRNYSIIYDAINDVEEAMEGMLSPELKEKVTGNLEIRETFKVSKVGTIAGCMVLDGRIYRNSKVRLIRDGVVIYTGELASLKRYKDDVKEVNKGYECGLNIKNYNDVKVGDIIEAYETVEVRKKLK